MGAQEWAVDLNGFIVPIGDGEAIDVLETGITVVLAADHDRDVAEAEARGWNLAVEAASEAVDGGFTTLANDPEVDQVGRDLVHAYLAGALDAIAALRKPEVEG